MRPLALFALLISSAVSAAPAECKRGHTVESVSADGATVVLEDGTQWEIQPMDRTSSTLWQPSMGVTACRGMLTNTEIGESVGANRVDNP